MSAYTKIPIGFKKCMKCGKILPATREFFYFRGGVDREKNKPRSACISCFLRERQGYTSTPQGKKARLKTQKKYRESEHGAKKIKEWIVSENGKRSRKKYYKKYYATEKGKRRYIEYSRKWYKTPRGKFKKREKDARRKKRLIQAEGTFTADDIQLIFISQKGCCWWCGKKVGNNYHVDHRVPISRGGSNYPENLVISCPTCNLSKGSKLPGEWNGRLL